MDSIRRTHIWNTPFYLTFQCCAIWIIVHIKMLTYLCEKKKKKVWILKSNTLKCQIATKFISPFQRLRLKCCSNKFILEWFKWFQNSRLFRFYACMYTMFALKILCTFLIYPEIVGRPIFVIMKLIIIFLFHYIWTLVWLC